MKYNHLTILFKTLFIGFVSTLGMAQSVPNASSLSIPQIMQGERFVGFSPDDIYWGEDSKTIYFSWNPKMRPTRSLHQVNIENILSADTTTSAATPPIDTVAWASQRIMPSPYGHYSKDRKFKVYEKNGDIFIYDVDADTSYAITNTIEREDRPRFFSDNNASSFLDKGLRVVYHKNNNLYIWDRSGGTTQITNFKKGKKKAKKKLSEQDQWLQDDQLANFDILRQRKTMRDLQKDQRDSLRPKRPLEIYYGQKSIGNIRLSPDMRFVTFRLTQRAKPNRTKVPDFVTEKGYLNDINARPKVGHPQNTYEMGIYDRQRDTFYILDIKELANMYNKPAFLKDYHKGEGEYNAKYNEPRAVIFHGPVFSEDRPNSRAVVEIKALDNKDRWIVLVDLASGKMDLLDHQHDAAWIGGPGISGWNGVGGNIGWIDDERVYFQSEKTGYSHLYTVNVATKEVQPLTSGKFEIINAQLSQDHTYFYITSNKENPHEHHFYKMPSNGGAMLQLTQKVGNHQVRISPDEKYLAIRYSYSNQPWELYVMENKQGAKMQRVTTSTTQAFDDYSWRVPEIIRFKASDGVEVPARLYRPKAAKPNAPAVIFVHGAGYLQNVHSWWSSYYREYMFHNLLVDNGYTVLDIDYRASNGYGRDWRTAIYRHMGSKDLSDQVDGAKYLVETLDIDANRIGIYGGSYGGFITLMAMFNAPETFKCGAALRSVTDWAHYNHPYTSNILNTPVEDSIAYHQSSPIYFAEGLQGHLLILHGMVDANVQFQDVVRLSQRLIELEKDNWEFAVFPMEGHGFREPSSWADEYKRIYKLFQSQLVGD